MGLLKEINDQIAETENRVNILIQRLEEQTALEESLDAAQHGITQASGHIGELASTLKRSVVEFRRVIEAFRNVDPERIIEAISVLTIQCTQLSNAVEGFSRKQLQTTDVVSEIRMRLDKVERKTSDLTKKVTEAASEVRTHVTAVEQDTRSFTEKEIERNSRIQSDSIRGVKRIAYITMLVAFLLLMLEISRSF